MKYYLGPYAQVDTDEGIGFAMPVGAVQCINIRPVLNICFLVTPDSVDLGVGYELIGQGNSIDQVVLNQARLTTWSDTLGLAPVTSTNLLDLLWDTVTIHAGDYPLMPTSAGNLELYMGGDQPLRSKRFDLEMPEAANVIASIKNQYRFAREETLAGRHAPDTYRRVLDAWGEQFKVDKPQLLFIPDDLPTETPLPHATVFTESFNQADSTTLGPDLTWTETNSDLETVSNRCRAVSASLTFAEARAEHDLSSSNNYAKAVVLKGGISVSTNLNRALCRFQSGARTHYGAGLKANNDYELFRRVGGASTSIDSGVHSWSDNDVLECRADGTTISIYVNAGLVSAKTDMIIASGLRGGILNRRSTIGVEIESFETGDIAVGVVTPLSAFTPNTQLSVRSH